MDSVAALKIALAVAQVDRQIGNDELTIFERLLSLECLDSWDSMALRALAPKPIDLDPLLDAIRDLVERQYVLALCYVMALAGGLSPPENVAVRKIASRWGFDEKALLACRREGEKLFQQLL